MEGAVNVEWHGQDYLHLKWHVVCSGLATSGLSGSLARGKRDLSPAASRRFPRVLGDTVGATCARISSLYTATDARTMRRSWRASVLLGSPESGLRVWECSADHCWKQRHATDTFCPTCAAIRRHIHPASRRPTMRPHSNGRIATTGARCLAQSIAGWHSAPLWQFACENTRPRCRQMELHCVLMWLFGHTLLFLT